MTERVRRRFRTAPALLSAGLLSTALLGLSTTGTLSGFLAVLTNDTTAAGTGTLVMQQLDSSHAAVCSSTDASGGISTNQASCSFNLFGGSTTLIPGSSPTTVVYVKNTGTVTPSSFTLLPSAACTQTTNGSQSGTGNLCTQLQVKVFRGTTPTGTPVFSGTAASLGTAGVGDFTSFPTPPAPGAEVPFTFQVLVPAGAGNTYQGLSVAVPLVWTFAA